MTRFSDPLGQLRELPSPPQRIVSLVPSQTELLFDLGLDEEVAGITKFCIHPDRAFRTKTRVGGTKTVQLDRVRELKPDLILANKEENVKEQIETLAADFPLWMSDINTLDEAMEMIRVIGELTGRAPQAGVINREIECRFSGLPVPGEPVPAAYLIWREPYMTVGGDTFINEMLTLAGFTNSFGSLGRYPSVSVDDLRESGCRVVLLSSEPYPFKDSHAEELRSQLAGVEVCLVDGELFSWYGSRLMHTPGYIRSLRQQLSLFS